VYRVTTGIHLHFAHHLAGHPGACISLHGHTWKFEVSLQAEELDPSGFVTDFDHVHEAVFAPCHRLLDHSLALGDKSYAGSRELLVALGRNLVGSRLETLGDLGTPPTVSEEPLGGARNEQPGGIKVAVFPFSPTSERIAEWLYRVAEERLGSARVSVARARVFEALHPVEAVAEFTPPA
jgi:6-pyruvoyl-tetrahydropterin synthase